MGIQSYIMGIWFLIWKYFMRFLLILLIQWFCIIAVIAIFYGPQQLRIVFISWVCHSRLFALRVKLVQDILTTFEYDKIYWLLDKCIIRNQMFLMLCLIICFFSLFTLSWTHSNSFFSVELSSTITLFDSPSSIEHTCDKFSSTGKSFYLLSFVEQKCEVLMCF